MLEIMSWVMSQTVIKQGSSDQTDWRLGGDLNKDTCRLLVQEQLILRSRSGCSVHFGHIVLDTMRNPVLGLDLHTAKRGYFDLDWINR